MPDLERWQYGDPLEVAIRKEAQLCKGCHSIETVKIFGTIRMICDDGQPKEKRCKKWKAKT